MSADFSPGGLINIAIGIERSALTFFDIMARTSDAGLARDVFEEFVQMEREHLNTFQDMLPEMAGETAPAALTPETSEYLQALIDDAVFTNDAIMNEAVSRADSDAMALEVGIGAEKDSILFYQAMREVLPSRAAAVVDKIISGEKAHLRRLTEIKKTLGTPR